MIICSNDLAQTQANYRTRLLSIAPIVKTWRIVSTATDLAEMLMLQCYSIPRFTKCLFRADMDMYRRWKSITDITLVMVYELCFGWEAISHKQKLTAKEAKLVYAEILENRNSTILSLKDSGSGCVDVGGGIQPNKQEIGMQRYGSVIKLKPEKAAEYKELHAHVWPKVLAMIHACHIRNYSIYLKDGYLFSYFEYHGEDFDVDMQKMDADPTTQAWWKLTDPCQEPLATRQPGEWWASMEEVFHVD